MKSDSNFFEKKLSYCIYGIFLKVGKELGIDFKEHVYQRTCEEELKFSRINYIAKPEIDLYSKTTNQKIGIFIPDLVIDDKIIIEIKVQKEVNNDSIRQLMKYLEYSKYEIGYLVNFGSRHIQIIRRIFTNDRKERGQARTSTDEYGQSQTQRSVVGL